jgi:hypothetical protein
VKISFLESKQNLEITKTNWRPSKPGFIIQKLAPLSNARTRMLDASRSVGGIPKLCRKSGLDISRLHAFLTQKANDHSLVELHEKW